MISINCPVNRQYRSKRSDGLLVLEPPRHSHLPLSFLGPGKHLIGTSEDCSIHVTTDGVQPRHAMILVGDQVILLKALDSRTWVNDSAVSEIALRTGDRLSIGPLTFRLRLATADELKNYESSEKDDQNAKTEEAVHRHFRSDFPHSAPLDIALNPDSIISQETVVAAPEMVLPPPVPVEDIATIGTGNDAESSALPFRIASVSGSQTSDSVVTYRTTLSEDDTRIQQTQNAPASESPVRGIERQIAILNDDASIVFAARESLQTIEEKQRLAAREEELKRLADELSRQSQRLRERMDRVSEREDELDRKHALLAAENERLVATAETTRRELSDEYARQMTLWQEWDGAYRRTAEELKSQLETVEQRRMAVQIENEKLAADRAEIQRLHEEYDRERRAAAAERVQAATELGELHALRSAFETERRQHIVDLQERESRYASDRSALTAAQDEMLATRQQIEHDRTLFATERSSESLRRELEIREHTQARIRLNDEESELQSMRYEIESARRLLDEQRTEFLREKELFDAARSDVDELRVKLNNAETELTLVRQSHREQQSLKEAADDEFRQRQEELQQLQRTIEAQKAQLEIDQASLRDEQNELDAAYAKLAANMPAPRMDDPYLNSHNNPPDGYPALFNTSVDDLLGISSAERIHNSTRPPSESYSSQPRTFEPRTLVTGNHPESVHQLPPPIPFTEGTTSAFPSPLTIGDFGTSIPLGKQSFESAFTSIPLEHDPASEFIAENRAYGSLAAQSFDNTELAPTALEPESFSTLATATALIDDATVDETLQDISQRFGYVKPQMDQSRPSLVTEDNPVAANDSNFALASDRMTESSTNAWPSAVEAAIAPSAEGSSLESLRAQLAQMFSLSDDLKSESSGTSESDLIQTEAMNLVESHSKEASANTSESVGANLISQAESSTIADPIVETTDAPVEVEDEWTRRLRELSKVAHGDSSPPQSQSQSQSQSAPVLQPNSKVENPATVNETEDEFSVEAQLARLLGRPLSGGVKNQVATSNPLPAEDVSHGGSESGESHNDEHPVDRSHLAAEPKHRQNKNAVREEVQSFRAVAQMSARTALAKHSWNNLRNEFYFTSGLTVVSSIASLWYIGTYVYGTEAQIWKGITCAVATIVCGQKLIRSSAQLTLWRRKLKTRRGEDTVSTVSKVASEVESGDENLLRIHNSNDSPTATE